MIQITNHGPLVRSSNFWGSDLERAGKLFVSINAGTIRILLPRKMHPHVNEMRRAKYCILSRGPWPEMQKKEGIEILFEDNLDAPFVLHLTPESFDLLPAEPPTGQDWILTVWVLKEDAPHKALERPCFYRRVPEIPWMKEWNYE